MPVFTIKLLAKEANAIIKLIPSCHHSAYIKQVEIVMNQFSTWCETCPAALQLEYFKHSRDYEKLKQKFLDLVFEAHSLTKASSTQTSLHWDIQYQSSHLADSHKINDTQTQNLKEARAEIARRQHETIIRLRAKMAIKSNERVTPIRWTEPNGLDAVSVYFCDQKKIANFMDTQLAQVNVRNDWIEVARMAEQPIMCNAIPAAENDASKIRPRKEASDESPPKRRRVDNMDSSMLL